MDELTSHLVDAGLATKTAPRAATELPLDEQSFFDFTARTVFGVDPAELGSPWTAAISSFVLVSAGALRDGSHQWSPFGAVADLRAPRHVVAVPPRTVMPVG